MGVLHHQATVTSMPEPPALCKESPLGKAPITDTDKSIFWIYKQLIFAWTDLVVRGDGSDGSVNSLPEFWCLDIKLKVLQSFRFRYSDGDSNSDSDRQQDDLFLIIEVRVCDYMRVCLYKGKALAT